MSERRSGRSRKQVDYAKFEADNDDDFANPTPPPSKKKKTSEKGEGRREKEKPAKVTSSDKPTGRKERLPLDDKLYERDLQAALEMSLQEPESQPDEDEEMISKTVKSLAILHSTPLVDSDRALAKTEDPEDSQSIMPSAIPHGVTADNNIEFLGTVTCSDSESSPPAKRRAAARGKRKSSTVFDESTDDDDDFGDEDSSESDSDFNDADSDFDDGKVKVKSIKKVKGKAAPKQSKASAAAAAEKKHRTATKCNSKAPSAGQAVATPKSAVSSTAQSKAASSVSHRVGASVSTSATPKAAVSSLPSAPHKTPVWTPPGRSDSSNSGSGAALKSPSSGLRLGLSRHARTKPLHPSLKVS